MRVLRSLRPKAASDVAATPVAEAVPRPRGGKYDAALVELATKRPGITVAEAAGEIGVTASGLYPTIRRLESQGRLAKRGRGLHA